MLIANINFRIFTSQVGVHFTCSMKDKNIETFAKLNPDAPLFTSFYGHPGHGLLDRFDNPTPVMALPIECGWKRTSRHDPAKHVDVCSFQRVKSMPIPANWLWNRIKKWSNERATKPFSLTKYNKATVVGLSSGTSNCCLPLSSISLVLVPNFWHWYRTSARTWGELQPSPSWFLMLQKRKTMCNQHTSQT